MRTTVNRSARRIALAISLIFALSVACTATAAAQDAWRFTRQAVASEPVTSEPVTSEPVTSAPLPAAGLPDAVGVDDAAADQPISPEDRALIDKVLTDKALSDDAFATGKALPLKQPRRISLVTPKKLDVARAARPDGSSTVTLKQPLPIDWDAKVGADLGVAGNAPDTLQPPPVVLPTTHDNNGVGAAFASVDVASLATVDARVDPNADQSLLATTVTRSVPLGRQFGVTLQSRAQMTESYNQSSTTDASRVWSNANTAKFNILPTGTTLAAGLSSTSTDPVTHNTLSAEQKLYGALNLTTAISDLGQSGENKSISARFKFDW
jgi:hypothetical protein